MECADEWLGRATNKSCAPEVALPIEKYNSVAAQIIGLQAGEVKTMLRLQKAKTPVLASERSLQDPFLDALRSNLVPVSIYLVNGIKLIGQIESFDQFSVLLRNTAGQVIYKRAISTIVAGRDVRLPTDESEEASL